MTETERERERERERVLECLLQCMKIETRKKLLQHSKLNMQDKLIHQFFCLGSVYYLWVQNREQINMKQRS